MHSWALLSFELLLGETRPAAVCLRSSVTLPLQDLVDIAYLLWFHSRHGWCVWLYEPGQNRQTNVMVLRHAPGQLAEAVILAHPPSAPTARSRRLFLFYRRTCTSFHIIPVGPPTLRADRNLHKRAA